MLQRARPPSSLASQLPPAAFCAPICRKRVGAWILGVVVEFGGLFTIWLLRNYRQPIFFKELLILIQVVYLNDGVYLNDVN